MTRFRIREKIAVFSILIVLSFVGAVAMTYSDRDPVDF